MTVKSVLQNFGLTENEANVYLILLKLGSAIASEIAKKTHIHRINVYDILERLQERGLASFIIIGKTKHYEATNPKKILEIEDERRKNIKEILPELNSLKSTIKQQQATIYKDKNSVKNAIEDVTKAKGESYLFASAWGFKTHFPRYNDIWYAKLRANKVKMKCLVSKKFRNTEIQKPLQAKYLPNEFVFPSTTLVYNDKILIIVWSAQPLAILIRGGKISDSYKEYFKLLWRIAKK